ncbi:MAG: exodeoxyribonuclease V subunit gamma [Firmicutes bacterium]|nr:exodeoxyribonuclease V subunit gamma [Bacillota bacterium]
MGIKFVIGTSGSGKTYYARQKTAEIALSDNKAALLVPEQFSFETERAMLNLLEPKYANDVEVFSFTRLASRVSRQTGGIAGKRLDDCGRAALINVAMGQVRDYLNLYAGKKKGQDFIASMLSAICEFKSCAITPEMLNDAASKASESALAQKLKELSLIYGAYNACLANVGSIDPLDDLSRLAQNLEDVDYFGGVTVICDSFTCFTRQELAVVKKIIEQCDDFIITLCCDKSYSTASDGLNLFSSVHKTIELISEFDSDISYEYLGEHPRFSSRELAALESKVFRFSNRQPYIEASENVTIYSAADKYEEAEFTAREIRRLVRENDMRWRDFAVICRSESEYQGQLIRALELQGIPYFCDKRTAINNSPIIRFALYALDIVNNKWRSEDIFRWVKTGMIDDFTMMEASALENYCFVWGITGNKWQKEFTQSPYGYSDKEHENEREILEKINNSRKKIVDLLGDFENAVKKDGVNGIDLSAAMYNLLDSSGAARCIERMIPKLSQEAAEEQGQIWNSLMNILDQLANILSETKVSVTEFTDLFTLMVGSCDVGQIPQSMDQVVFGAADRIRTANPKVVFVLGANDGVFPMAPKQSGVFTENERKELISMQIPLSGDMEESAVSEQFLAYTAITCASEKLYVTYSNVCNGEALYSSEIVSELRMILPQCRNISSCGKASLDMIEGAEAGFLLASACVNDSTEFSESLIEVYRNRTEYADKIKVVTQANEKSDLALHDKKNIYSLFGKNIKISASKAECFHNCKFMYFCKYGMQAVPRRRAELNPLEYGSVVHYVLEKLLKNHDVSLLSDSAQLNEKIAFYLEEYLKNVMGGSDTKSARFLYLFRRLVETLSVLAIQLSEEFAKSLFRPGAFELPIDGINVQPLKIPLSDGTEISVGGKIDRVDVFRSDGKSYVRVVDYKTGSKEFLLSDILAGLNMQMLIYLDIICGEEASPDTPEPAGVVYSPASIGKVKGIRGETSFDMERREMLKKNGLIMDDSEIINAMEIGMEKKVDKKENANVKGTSTFRSSATYVANKKQFAEIRMYMRKLLKNMGESLHRGEIEASPAKGIYDACAYCDYSVMCTAEQKENGREISKKSMSETMKLIEEDDD